MHVCIFTNQPIIPPLFQESPYMYTAFMPKASLLHILQVWHFLCDSAILRRASPFFRAALGILEEMRLSWGYWNWGSGFRCLHFSFTYQPSGLGRQERYKDNMYIYWYYSICFSFSIFLHLWGPFKQIALVQVISSLRVVIQNVGWHQTKKCKT